MIGPREAAVSAALGMALGAGAAALALILQRHLARRAPTLFSALAIGTALRLAAAAAGVTLGVLARPPSVALFVGAFLLDYAAVLALALVAARRRARRG